MTSLALVRRAPSELDSLQTDIKGNCAFQLTGEAVLTHGRNKENPEMMPMPCNDNKYSLVEVLAL